MSSLPIRALACVLILGGLIAAFVGGWANFFAYKEMMPESAYRWVWGLAGIAASLVTVAAFSVFHWKRHEGRHIVECVRVFLVGILASVMGVVGTVQYMSAGLDTQDANARQAQLHQGVLQTQIVDWRAELRTTPSGIGTPESIQTYLTEVEEAGRTNERPYRMAVIDLGHAMRRASLEESIQEAETTLVENVSGQTDAPTQPISILLIAIILELFASQATSAGAAVFFAHRSARNPAWMETQIAAQMR